MINDFVGYRTVFVDVNHSVKTNMIAPVVGPFYLYVTKDLSRFLGINHFYCPLIFRPSYLVYLYSGPIKKKYYQIRTFLRLRGRYLALKSYVNDILHKWFLYALQDLNHDTWQQVVK